MDRDCAKRSESLGVTAGDHNSSSLWACSQNGSVAFRCRKRKTDKMDKTVSGNGLIACGFAAGGVASQRQASRRPCGLAERRATGRSVGRSVGGLLG